MADTTTQSVGIPIGQNGSLVQGTLITNKNGDAEWYQKGASYPTFTSNASNNYQWQPSPNCFDFLGSVTCPTADQKQQFYSSTSSTTTLNNARLSTFNSPTGLNSPELAKQLNIPGANTAAPTSPSEAGDQESQIKPESVTKGFESLNLSISNNPNTRSVKNYPNEQLLRYPISRKKNQDYVTFTMLEYFPKKFSGASFQTGDIQLSRPNPSDTKSRNRGSTVSLPMQPTISDLNTVQWGSDELNAFQGIAAAAAMTAILDSNDFKQTGAAAEEIVKLISSSKNNDLKTVLASYFAGSAAGVKGLLTRATGGIINPNLELLFQGPNLRTFNFNFSLSAREDTEAKVIRNIIRFFKQGMSVKRASTGLFLKSPYTFEIKYWLGGKTENDAPTEHPWINRIKECALTSCNVNYTPAGNYATYEDGAMTQYDISLSFSELEPIYDDDYGNGGGTGNETEIGY